MLSFAPAVPWPAKRISVTRTGECATYVFSASRRSDVDATRHQPCLRDRPARQGLGGPLCPGHRSGSREPEAAERPFTPGGVSDHYLASHSHADPSADRGWVDFVVDGLEFV